MAGQQPQPLLLLEVDQPKGALLRSWVANTPKFAGRLGSLVILPH
jgi:hypothetical protein